MDPVTENLLRDLASSPTDLKRLVISALWRKDTGRDRSQGDLAVGTGRPEALGLGSRLAPLSRNHDHRADESIGDDGRSRSIAAARASRGGYARVTPAAATGRVT